MLNGVHSLLNSPEYVSRNATVAIYNARLAGFQKVAERSGEAFVRLTRALRGVFTIQVLVIMPDFELHSDVSC